MRKHIGFKVIIIMGILLLVFVSLRIMSNEREKQLDQRLAAIRAQNKGEGTDWGQLEIECLRLLKEYNSPEDKGKIYVAIAFIYSETGFARKDIQLPKTIEYCQIASRYPLDVATACLIYGRWAGALESEYRDLKGEEFTAARREIVTLYLTGLKPLLNMDLPNKRQKLPGGGMLLDYSGPRTDPAYQKRLKENEAQRKARKKIMLENKLIYYRYVFKQKCIDLYRKKPVDADEFENIAEQILNPEVSKKFISEIKPHINKKSKTLEKWYD